MGILVVILIIAAAWLILNGSNDKASNPPADSNATSTENSTPNQTGKAVTDEEISAVVRQAIDSRDLEACDKIAEEGANQYCVNNVLITKASDAQDETICNQISDEFTQNACKDNVIFSKARNEKDPSLCNKLLEKGRIETCKKEASQ